LGALEVQQLLVMLRGLHPQRRRRRTLRMLGQVAAAWWLLQRRRRSLAAAVGLLRLAAVAAQLCHTTLLRALLELRMLCDGGAGMECGGGVGILQCRRVSGGEARGRRCTQQLSSSAGSSDSRQATTQLRV
jgi:hypothetical protein